MKKTQVIIVALAIIASVIVGVGAGHIAGGHAPSDSDWTPVIVATATPLANNDATDAVQPARSTPLNGG
jgi:hypothetical protein